MSEIVTKLNGQSFELQMWEEVKKDCGYPEEDNNNGFIYGCHSIDEDGQILDCNWFKSEEERRLFYHTQKGGSTSKRLQLLLEFFLFGIRNNVQLGKKKANNCSF